MYMKKKDDTIKSLSRKIGRLVTDWGYSVAHKDEKIIDVKKWLSNFDVDEIEPMFNLLCHVDLKNDNDISKRLHDLSRLILSKFQANHKRVCIFDIGEGKATSGTQFLYRLKAWLEADSFHQCRNLFPDDKNYIQHAKSADAFIFIDDLIGSGKQSAEFYKKHLEKLGVPCYYYALYGFEEGINFSKNSGFKEVRAMEVLKSGDRIFSDKSDLKDKELCKEIALKYGQQLYPKGPLGYSGLEAMICFTDGCPNNTLPIIWASLSNECRVNWHPIFERKKGVETEEDKEKQKPKNTLGPKETIEAFYDHIRENTFPQAFDLLSHKKRFERYQNNVDRFAVGYRNTKGIQDVNCLELKNRPDYYRALVQYDEQIIVYDYKGMVKNAKCTLSELDKVYGRINEFKEFLINEFSVDAGKLDEILQHHAFNINAVEEICWLCEIPYDRMHSVFTEREYRSISRLKYIECRKKDNEWLIYSFVPAQSNSETYGQ